MAWDLAILAIWAFNFWAWARNFARAKRDRMTGWRHWVPRILTFFCLGVLLSLGVAFVRRYLL